MVASVHAATFTHHQQVKVPWTTPPSDVPQPRAPRLKPYRYSIELIVFRLASSLLQFITRNEYKVKFLCNFHIFILSDYVAIIMRGYKNKRRGGKHSERTQCPAANLSNSFTFPFIHSATHLSRNCCPARDGITGGGDGASATLLLL